MVKLTEPVNSIESTYSATLPEPTFIVNVAFEPTSTITTSGAVRPEPTLGLPIGLYSPKYSMFFWFPPPLTFEPARVIMPSPETTPCVPCLS